MKNKILFLLGIFILALAVSAAMPSAEAGTMLVQPEPGEKLAPGESYPESRFGRPPAKVDTGVSRSYASRAVEEMETSDEADAAAALSNGGRRPAGLQFTDGALSRSTMPKALSEPTETTLSHLVSSRKGVQEVAIIASDLGYFPKTVFVSRDVPVRLFVTGSSKNTLCIMMDSFTIRKQVRSQRIEEITFTPGVPGKYRFYCPVNGMEGTLVVKEFASQESFEPVASRPAPATRFNADGDAVATQAAAPARGMASGNIFDARVPDADPQPLQSLKKE
jgi:plastocyanin